MKSKKTIKWLVAIFVISITMYSQEGFAQTRRLPDGSTIYSDGTIRLPNGQVRYPNTTNATTYPSNYPNYGTGRYPRTAVRQSDGSTIYPDGRIVYADGTVRYPDGRVYSPSNNSRWIPPGQAKKMYGGNARNYAPGQNKNRDRDYNRDGDRRNSNRDNDNDQGRNNRGRGNGKHGHDD